MYGELCNPIKSKQLHEYDRWGILNDLWACVFAGYASLNDLLQIIDWYDEEDQVFVLREIASQCTEISHLLRFTDHGKELFHRFRAPFSKALNNLGWKSTEKEEPHLKQLRPIAISFLIRSGDEVVKQQALSMARSYLENASLDPDIRGACLSAVSNDGTRQSFDTVKKAYEEKDKY